MLVSFHNCFYFIHFLFVFVSFLNLSEIPEETFVIHLHGAQHGFSFWTSWICTEIQENNYCHPDAYAQPFCQQSSLLTLFPHVHKCWTQSFLNPLLMQEGGFCWILRLLCPVEHFFSPVLATKDQRLSQQKAKAVVSLHSTCSEHKFLSAVWSRLSLSRSVFHLDRFFRWAKRLELCTGTFSISLVSTEDTCAWGTIEESWTRFISPVSSSAAFVAKRQINVSQLLRSSRADYYYIADSM